MFLKKLCCCLAFVSTVAFSQAALNEPAPATPAPAPAPAPQAGPASGNLSSENGSTISVFVKSPEEIRALQEDLKSLQTMAGGSNPEIDSLMKRANRIAEMNDRCASISLNDLLDTTCGHFYQVELPAFENKFMELTGEVRLGSMRMATTLEERTRQLASCSEALTSIVISRDQLLSLRGNIYLEPINFEGDFDAEYSYTLSYDPSRLEQQQRLANLWIEKCGSIVLRQSGSEFAPMFIATLKVKNDSLKKNGSNVKFMMDQKNLGLRVDMRRPVNGAYYLNGVRMFEKTLDASGKASHLKFDIKNKKAHLTVPESGVIEAFNGRQAFNKLKKPEMIGRWMWDSEKLPDEVAATQEESESMTAEDSLTYKQGIEELARAEEAAKNEEKAKVAAEASKKDELERQAAEERQAIKDAQARKAAEDATGGKPVVRIIPVAISGAVLIGGVVVAALFDGKAKKEVDDYEKNMSHVASGDDLANVREKEEYSSHKDNVKKYQTVRNVGIGAAIVGAVGVGLSFVF
ncbi:MAG: cell envelope integrity protein TolA [Fibrobacter sp.]|nr:cell envelope integrity protein TolA [Fibrobacter sp.]